MRALTKILLLLLTLTMVSCGGAAKKIQFKGIDSFKLHGWSGVDVSLIIDNGSSHKITLSEANVLFYLEESCVGEATLVQKAVAPQRTATAIPTRWKIRLADPIAALMVTNKIARKEYDGLYISFTVKAKMGWLKRKFSQERIPLSNFLRIFESPNSQDVRRNDF